MMIGVNMATRKRRVAVEVQQDRAKKDSPWYSNVIRDIFCQFGKTCEVFCDKHTFDFISAPLDDEQIQQWWALLQAAIKKDTELGKTLIVTAEGHSGWDDYQLLHHFDPQEPVDNLLMTVEEIIHESDFGSQ